MHHLICVFDEFIPFKDISERRMYLFVLHLSGFIPFEEKSGKAMVTIHTFPKITDRKYESACSRLKQIHPFGKKTMKKDE